MTRDAIKLVSPKTPYLRRRRAIRGRSVVRTGLAPQSIAVQPGQLTSPLMKFGFPSLALH